MKTTKGGYKSEKIFFDSITKIKNYLRSNSINYF